MLFRSVCHGPAVAHTRDPVHNRVRNPAARTAVELNTFCGQCHRLILEDDREATDVRDPRNSRNEPLWLAASACFRNSKGGLSCLQCHSPHEPLERNMSAYNRVCASCHAAPRHSQSIREQACVECHMPAIQFENLAFRNHRIAVYSPADPVVPLSAKRR